jgi:hypothetical protein
MVARPITEKYTWIIKGKNRNDRSKPKLDVPFRIDREDRHAAWSKCLSLKIIENR